MQLEPTIRHRKFHFPTAALIVLLTTAIMACAVPAAAPVEVTRIVEQPGPEVTREVQVTRVVPAPAVVILRSAQSRAFGLVGTLLPTRPI